MAWIQGGAASKSSVSIEIFAFGNNKYMTVQIAVKCGTRYRYFYPAPSCRAACVRGMRVSVSVQACVYQHTSRDPEIIKLKATEGAYLMQNIRTEHS